MTQSRLRACSRSSPRSSSRSGSPRAAATTMTMGTAAATSANLIEENPDNNGVQVTVGSKNFTEQYILGEIYAQGLEAAGYDVKTQLNLGSEVIALRALEDGEIDAYPEYTSTALTSFFKTPPEDVPNAQQAFEDSQAEFEQEG